MPLSPLVVVFCMDGIKYELASQVCLMLPFSPFLDKLVFFISVLSCTVESSLSDDKNAGFA